MLEFKYIKDRGDLNLERVVFKASLDCDLGRFMAFKAKKAEEGISNKIEFPFWFPDKKVKQGDTVVLYSKKKRSNEKSNQDGSTSFFYYWGQETPMFTENDDCVLLIETKRWITGK